MFSYQSLNILQAAQSRVKMDVFISILNVSCTTSTISTIGGSTKVISKIDVFISVSYRQGTKGIRAKDT
jgi:hypothetical protein